jgi:hypothetical protein
MCASEKQLDAWPESKEELLALIGSFERLQKQHAGEYSLRLSVFGVLTTQVEIDAVLKANDKLGAAGELLYQKLDFWS